MGTYTLGTLTTVPVFDRPDLVAAPVLAALERLGLTGEVGVVEIDAALSDTAATEEAYSLVGDDLANCVVVAGKREGEERVAACLVLSSTRADVNTVVRKRLDVRKTSFLPMDRAVEESGMEYGGITPIGLPDDWPVLIDARVLERPVVVIGSGVRRSKLLVPPSVLAALPTAEVIEGLARPVEG